MNQYAQNLTVADAAPSERALFIRRTYGHLAGAILLFVALTAYMVNSPIADMMLKMMGSRLSWFMVLGAFMIVGHMATRLATSTASPSMQYLGLTLYVIFESVIFTPILFIAAYYSSPEVLPTAGILTLGIAGGLTLVAFTTKKDFSFLRGILTVGFVVAMGLIACALLFGFNLGLIFSFAMVLLAAGSILYTTSNMIHHYGTDQHVAASLQLFSSVALLFWYILRIVMSFSRR